MKIGTAVLIILMCSCTSVQGKNTEQKVEDITFSRLFPVDNWDEAHYGLSIVTTALEKKLIEDSCGITAPSSDDDKAAATSAVIISTLVGAAIKLGVKAIDSKLQNELKEYSAEYDATYGGTWPSTKCWRMVRAVRKHDPVSGSPTEIIMFDALFAMEGHSGVTKIAPVRIAFHSPSAKKKSETGKYGIALSVSVKSLGEKGFDTVAERLVTKTKIHVTKLDPQPVQYFPSYPEHCENADGYPLYCGKFTNDKFMSPVSAGSRVEVTATIAEVGEVPKFKKKIATLFSAASEDMGIALAEIAAAKINPDED